MNELYKTLRNVREKCMDDKTRYGGGVDVFVILNDREYESLEPIVSEYHITDERLARSSPQGVIRDMAEVGLYDCIGKLRSDSE